jgi:LCP family protein required for cell wall assembly
MQPRPAPPTQRRSAFAAAFFSFLIPGLGQAYLHRWGRALLWFVPWLVAVGLVAAYALSMGLKEFGTQFLSPSFLNGVLIAILIDLLYRLASVLDAWLLARFTGQGGAPIAQLGSVAGLVAILSVLVVSHVAIARPVFQASDYLQTLDDGGDEDPFQTLPPDVAASLGIVTPPPAATVAPGATVTPTPEPTPTPTQGPPWDGKQLLNILLIGADSGRASGYAGYLTDTMLTVSIDPRTKQVAFISLPRDMSGVPLPRNWAASRVYGGSYPGKINSLWTAARGAPSLFPGNDKQRGYNALKGALSELYGIDIKYYVAVNLSGFREAVETLGGVLVDVQTPVYDSAYPAEDGRGKLKLYIPPGFQFMDGRGALSYARARHASDDFERNERQQRVVTSVREQVDPSALLAPDVIRELLGDFRRSVRTDVPPDLLPAMIQLASEVDLDERISLVLSPRAGYASECYLSTQCPTSYELIANVPAIRNAVKNVFKTDREAARRRQRIEREAAVVQVLNGTSGPNTRSTNVADYLGQQGMDARVPPVNGGHADRNDYNRTQIQVYNGAETDKELTIERLKQIFEVEPELIADPNVDADVVVIVGERTPNLRPAT